VGISRILLPWDSQPQEPAELAKEGPIPTGGMKMLLMPTRTGLVDLVNPNQIWTPTNQASITVGPKGLQATLDGVNDYWASTGYPDIVGNVGTFFCWSPRIGTPDTNGQIWWSTSTGTAIFFQTTAVSTNDAWCFSQEIATVGVSDIYSSTNSSLVWSSDGTAAGKSFFHNGVSKGTASGVAPSSFSAGDKTFNFGRYTGSTTIDVNADTVIAGFTTDVWTTEHARLFHENPWQLFAPRIIWVPVSAASGSGASAALSNNLATTSAGTPVASLSLATTGNAATSAVGVVSPGITGALTGNAATASAGVVSLPGDTQVTGNAVTASVGTVTPSITLALTGNGATASVGTLGKAISLALSGLAGTSSAGIVIPGLSLALSGNGATSAAGTVTVPGSAINVALTGNLATTAVGTLGVPVTGATRSHAATIQETKMVAETKRIRFDFTSQLSSGETITTATTDLSVYSGADPLALLAWVGSPAAVGVAATQLITSGVAGCTYKLACYGVTTTGRQTFTHSFLTVL
jgi:hypothetical protein